MAVRDAKAGASGDSIHSFAPAVYFTLILLILVPAVDFLLNVWPASVREIGWRYGAVGLFAQYLHTPLLGFLLLSLYAAWRGDLRTLRTAGLVCVLCASLLLIANVGFALDALQLRAGVSADALRIFHIAVIRAFAKLTTAAMAFALIGVTSLRYVKRQKRTQAPKSARVARTPEATRAG